MPTPLSPLKRLGVVLGVLSAAMSLLAAYIVLPYRVESAEREIKSLKEHRETDHELLMRIDERLGMIQRKLDRP